MNFTIIFSLLLATLPANLQKISDGLVADHFKERKKARQEAMALKDDKKKILIQALKKSSDPEHTETAKELELSLIGALDKEIALKLLIQGKFKETKTAIRLDPDVFKEKYEGGMTLMDVAQTLGKKDFIQLYKDHKVPGSNKKMITLDVLVVDSDTWQSLAEDFNTRVEWIMILNKGKNLVPGTVIKIPRNQ